MKSLILSPKKILTCSLQIDSLEKLQKYYQLIKKNKSDLISPITVMNIKQYSFEKFEETLKNNECGLKEYDLKRELFHANNFRKTLESRFNMGTEYILCDGNHRSGAFILNGKDIPSRQMENIKDLRRINKEFSKNNSLGPYLMRTNFDKKYNNLEEYFFNLYRCMIYNNSYTIKGKIDNLMKSGELKIVEEIPIYEPQELPF